MNSHKKLTVSCLIALGIVGLNLTVDRVVAQSNGEIVEESNIPLDDQVRFIGELESRNSADWNFAVGEGEFTEDTYHLTMTQSDVRLVEQDRPQWRNMGMGTDYTILVDVYQDREILED